MTSHIDLMAETLEEALRDEVHDEGAFAELALSGERLRAACEPGHIPESVEALLSRCADRLRAGATHAPTDIAEAVREAVDALAEYAAQGDDAETGEALLRQVDQTLQVGLASMNVGAITPDALDAAIVFARERVRELGPRMGRLVESSLAWVAGNSAPESMPGLYAHRTVLADLSVGAIAFDGFVARSTQRQAAIETLVSSFEPSKLRVRRSAGDWLREALARVQGSIQSVAILSPAQAVSFDTGRTPDREQQVISLEILEVAAAGRDFFVTVAEGYRLDEVHASVDDRAVSSERLDEQNWMVSIPDDLESGALAIGVRVDDSEFIELPVIPFEQT